jgi:hypothetical protein
LSPGGLELRLGFFRVATRSERVIGQVTVNDQNQRRRSGPPKWNPDDGGFGGDVVSAQPFRRFVRKGAPDSSSTASQMVIPIPVVNIIKKIDLVAIATIIASRCRFVGVEQADSEIDIAS